MEKKRVVIGDDLTGCMDTGVFFYKKGIDTKVLLGADVFTEPIGSDVVVIDLETRNKPAKQAYEITKDAVARIKKSSYSLYYMKTDSTIRGNICEQIKALLDAGICQTVVFAPALVQSKRTTLNGIHYIDKTPVADTDIGKDPFSPVASSYLPDLFDEGSKTKILKLDIIRRGVCAIRAEIDKMIAQGAKVICADVAADNDLIMIAQSISGNDNNIMPCGSAGLLSAMLSGEKNMVIQSELVDPKLPLLTISASPAKASKKQIIKAVAAGVGYIKVKTGEVSGAKLADMAASILSKSENLIIDSAGPGKNEIAIQYGGDIKKMQMDAHIIEDTLAKCIEALIKKELSFSLLIFGGDTSRAILNKLGVKTIHIKGEAEPLVPAGIIATKDSKKLNVITKAGGFGTEDVIQNTLSYLKSKKDRSGR